MPRVMPLSFKFLGGRQPILLDAAKRRLPLIAKMGRDIVTHAALRLEARITETTIDYWQKSLILNIAIFRADEKRVTGRWC